MGKGFRNEQKLERRWNKGKYFKQFYKLLIYVFFVNFNIKRQRNFSCRLISSFKTLVNKGLILRREKANFIYVYFMNIRFIFNKSIY